MTLSEKLNQMDLKLPQVATPVGSYVPAIVVGDLVMTSGQIPMVDGSLVCTGKVGDDVTIDRAQEAARVCTLNALAAAGSAIGGIDNIARIVRVCVYVASAPSFTDQPKVANAASDLFFELFGEAGRHVRSALGVASLPLDVPVELELVAQIRK